MPPLTLVIANKNYSSWSLRPWLAMSELDIPFAERMLKFETDDWQANAATLLPVGLVPVLWEGSPGTGLATFDSLAILERLHELFPEAGIWPQDEAARARARSLAADFHAGYAALRSAMPMNIRNRYPGRGHSAAVLRDVERLCTLWQATRRDFGADGAFLFGRFCAIDAFYAPVASRFVTYDVALPAPARAYQEALLGTRSMRAWMAAAHAEREFVAADEPYADQRS